MKISIPEPCSEDWSKMTPTEKGAFCKKCALEVTDFTNKTALEIKSILTEKIESKTRVCGHIENRQLIELNDGFIPWKSDHESFRAVWMFSLIAVFGMTLFSCQSTFSKEIVEKMKTNSEMLMEEEKDSLDLAMLNDSLQKLKKDSLSSLNLASTTIDLNEITGLPMITLGGFYGEVEPWELEIVTWITLSGDICTVGSITTGVTQVEADPYESARFFMNPMEPVIPTPSTPSPNINERNQQHSVRTIAKHESGKPDFVAYISPNPIDKTSKMYLTIPDEGTLKLSIWELNTMSELYSEAFDLVFGNHTVDINFKDFPKGKYAAQLSWEEEKVVLPFEVLGNPMT